MSRREMRFMIHMLMPFIYWYCFPSYCCMKKMLSWLLIGISFYCTVWIFLVWWKHSYLCFWEGKICMAFKSIVYYQYMFFYFLLLFLKRINTLFSETFGILVMDTQFFIARAIIVVYHEYTNGARKMCAEVLLVLIHKLDMSFSNLSTFKKLRVLACMEYRY